MSDRQIQTLARIVAANPGDAQAANALAVALVRHGRGPSFTAYMVPPTTTMGMWGTWGGPHFGVDGRYRLSIQAGDGKYCAPRRDGLAVGEYSEWEVAIVDRDPESRGLVYVLDSPTFQGMPYADHWEGEGAVGPYVPSEGVQAIFDWCTFNLGRPQHASVFALRD